MKVKVLNLVCTCIMFVFALYGALSIFPYLEKDSWKPSMDRAIVLFSWFAVGEAVTEGVLVYYRPKNNPEKRLRIAASILLAVGWIVTMVGSIRVGVDLTRNWSVDGKKKFLSWNWAGVAIWGFRLGIVVPLTFWVENDDVHGNHTTVSTYDKSQDHSAFTIDDEFDEQLEDV